MILEELEQLISESTEKILYTLIYLASHELILRQMKKDGGMKKYET